MKAILAFLVVTVASCAGVVNGRPNVVVIFIDDMGYGDIGPFGSKLNETPHLDRMAKEGGSSLPFTSPPRSALRRARP